MEGKQFSSSRGVVIYVRDLLSRYQPDALRYFLSVAGPENQDSDFTWADFKTRTNSELVAGWGNLVNRTASLIHKNFGEIPAPGELQPVDQGLLATTSAGFDKVGGLLGTHRNRAAVSEAMRVVQEANRYISETEPWKLTGDRDRLGTVLHTAAQAVSATPTPCWRRSCRTPRRRCTRRSAAPARSRRCRGSTRSPTSTTTRATTR